MGKRRQGQARGVYEMPEVRAARWRVRRWITVGVLLAWDGLLLYMIVECLIAPVYGAAFVAVVSCYLGYHLVEA